MRKVLVGLGVVAMLGLCAEAFAREGGRPGGEQRQSMAERVKAMDTDGDGKVAADEWKGPEEGFKRLDANADGFIDQEEIARLARTMQGPPPMANPFFALADADADGKLSRDELQAAVAKLLKADENGDGFVDTAEFNKATTEAANAAAFKGLDKDADGKISKEEWQRGEESFGRADANSDGSIDLEEFAKTRSQMLRPMGPPGTTGAGGPGEWFARMDKDGDGKVTKEEFTGREELFTRLDANGDGAIDKEEMDRARDLRPGDRPRRPRPDGPDEPAQDGGGEA